MWPFYNSSIGWKSLFIAESCPTFFQYAEALQKPLEGWQDLKQEKVVTNEESANIFPTITPNT